LSSGANPLLKALFAARAASDGGEGSRVASPSCYVSRDDLFQWTDEPVRRMTGEMMRGVGSVVAAVNDFSTAQLASFTAQARGWFTLVRPDGCVPATLYPLTAWVAIYCVAAPQPSPQRRDSGVLRLYESRLGTMFSDATTSVMSIPYRPGHYSWRPVPGEMAVFPASITHEIALNRAADDLVLVTLRIRFVAPGQEGVPRW
jgi:hypothetical protein